VAAATAGVVAGVLGRELYKLWKRSNGSKRGISLSKIASKGRVLSISSSVVYGTLLRCQSKRARKNFLYFRLCWE